MDQSQSSLQSQQQFSNSQYGTAAKINSKILQNLERLNNFQEIFGNATLEVEDRLYMQSILQCLQNKQLLFNGLHDPQLARHSDSASIGEASHRNLGSWLLFCLQASSIETFRRMLELLIVVNISALLLCQQFSLNMAMVCIKSLHKFSKKLSALLDVIVQKVGSS